eukprot:SAG11_NODE_773_length_7236_cov_4.526412_5_plen_196_part_00
MHALRLNLAATSSRFFRSPPIARNHTNHSYISVTNIALQFGTQSGLLLALLPFLAEDKLPNLLELLDNSRHGNRARSHVALVWLHRTSVASTRAVVEVPPAPPQTVTIIHSLSTGGGKRATYGQKPAIRDSSFDHSKKASSFLTIRTSEYARHQHRLLVRAHFGEEIFGISSLDELEFVHLRAAPGHAAGQKACV